MIVFEDSFATSTVKEVCYLLAKWWYGCWYRIRCHCKEESNDGIKAVTILGNIFYCHIEVV